MTVEAPITADEAIVRSFLTIVHGAAASALNGASRPGLLQLVRIHPDLEDTVTLQFPIGDIDGMTTQAVIDANAGFNVYVEPRTVKARDRMQKGRGKASDTRGVFGFVVDDDADKGRGSRLSAVPSLKVETSPGNAHAWFFLARAVTADEAKPLGGAIRAASGADANTGVITQPYRIAGTPNFPGKKKRERGRIATPTSIIDHNGKAWSADELRAAFPDRPKPQNASAGPRAEGLTGKESHRAVDLLNATDGDRSAIFHSAAVAAYRDGLTVTDFEGLCRAAPDGCAGKFLHPYDRLVAEIERSWAKIEAHDARVRQGPERPTYADESATVDEARDAVAGAVLRFIEIATEYRRQGDDEAEPPVHGLNVSTGVGKTRATAKAVAEHILARRGTIEAPKPILYAVPTHRLGTEVEAQFAEHGVVARVFRGRQAPDPYHPESTMCDDLETVEIALSIGAPVQTACCKGKRPEGTEALCEHFMRCAYQRQRLDSPDVWIAAHQMLFHDQAAFGDVEMVIVDEAFWQAGTVIPKRGLTLDEIGAGVGFGKAKDDYLLNDVETYRARLSRALRRQEKERLGGVARKHLVVEGITTDLCTDAARAEWALKDKTPMWPGMPRAERQLAARVAEQAKHARGFIGLWHAAKELLYVEDENAVSGRLYLDSRSDEDGRVTVAKARGIREIVKRWRRPTLLLDATLPSLDILRAFYPQVTAAPPIEAAMPHVRVRQVRDAPTAARKLTIEDGQPSRNLCAVRREILRRFLQLGRQPVLVIAQKAVAEWLRESRLPSGIAVEWFNNVAGLDRYKHVRGLFVIGRTQPPPQGVEALAGALTGQQPALVERWYGKALHGIRTRNGERAGIECDKHPDPVAEACRWQVCDGELMQALGRARGVNRTADTPLDIDVLANVVLPLTVDDVTDWDAPSEVVEMVADGVVLASGADIAEAWPSVWPTAGAARNWILKHGPLTGNTVTKPFKSNIYKGSGDSVRPFRYQRAGRNQKWRGGAYDPAVVSDIRSWLENRLGELAGFELLGSASPAARPAILRAADYDPGLAASVRILAEGEPAPWPAEPVRAEAVVFDPAAGIRFPAAIAERLARLRAADAPNPAQRRRTITRPGDGRRHAASLIDRCAL